MVYVATGRALYVGVGIALFLAGSAALYNALGRVQQRVTVWLHPWTDERVYCSINGKLDFRQNCDSYQLVKSLYSIANGGYGGTGLGKGTFTTVDGTQLIPYLNTDFVYSAIAQELGLIGAAAVLLLVMVFVARGMRIALIAQDGFSKLLATGLTFGLALQTFIIVGGVLRVVPLTGITLPFVSYGGSSIVSNFVMLGIAPPRLEPCRRDGGATGEQADHPGRRARDGPPDRADRRDDVLADVGPPGARRAPGQRDPARGPVRDQARPDPLALPGARAQQGAPRRRTHVLLPPLPAGTARRARRRLLDRRPVAHGARAVAEPHPDRLGPQPLVARRPVPRQAERQADRRRHRRHDPRRERPARRPRRARHAAAARSSCSIRERGGCA